MPSELSQRALDNLRVSGQFDWIIVPCIVLVLYVYAVEVGRKNWSVILAGLALWGMDWFNEIWNALVFHFTQYAPVWAAPGDTAFLILIGLNIEISLMFAFLGVAAAKMLPRDPGLRICGVPNRWFLAVTWSIGCVVVELFLNAVDALTWDYWWWSAGSPIPIVILGYLTFFLVAFWVHDMQSVRRKAAAVGTIYGFDATCLIVFGPLLGWI